MNPDVEKITKEIQVLVDPYIIVELPINEAEYIAGQTGEYRKLAIYQAARSQLIRANVNPDVINYFQERIYNLGNELRRQKIQEYIDNKARVDNLSNFTCIENGPTVQLGGNLYTVGVNSTTVQYNTQCKDCGDTGWIVSHGPWIAGKYLCGCPKGKGKQYDSFKLDDIVIYGSKEIEPSRKENKLSPVLPILPEVKGRKFR